MDDEIDLTPPRILDSRYRNPPRQNRAHRASEYVMPPPGLTAVLNAVKRGSDTAQKLKRSLRKMDDKEIRKCLDSLLSIKSIYQDGRRYRYHSH